MVEGTGRNIVERHFNWWLNELAGALTPRRVGTQAWRTLARQTPGGLQIATRSGANTTLLGTLSEDASPSEIAAMHKLVAQKASLGPGNVLLRISSANVVERTIQIPKAASDVIEPVLRNQMERIVPWPSEETRFGYRVSGDNAAAPDQLNIQVVATTRGMIDNALRRARSIGLDPFAVDFAPDEAAEDTDSLELLTLTPDPVTKTAKVLRTALSLVAALAITIGAFGFYLMWNRQTESDDLEARVAAERMRVEEVKKLNAENTELRRQRQRLVRRKADEPAVMVLVEALSRALPDTAYLTDLEIHGGETRIVGKSDDPTALITILEDTPQFEDVHFSAPTTREQGETVGTFSIISRANGGYSLEAKR